MENAGNKSERPEKAVRYRETNLWQLKSNNVMDKTVDIAERMSTYYQVILNAMEVILNAMEHFLNAMEVILNAMEVILNAMEVILNAMKVILNAMEIIQENFRTEHGRDIQFFDKHFKKRQEQEKRQKDCDSYICLIGRKDHRVHYVPIDMFMNIDLPLHQQNNENEDNPMRKGTSFFHRLSWTFWSYSPFIKEIHKVGWNDPNESKSNKILDECITQTKDFQQGQKQKKYMKLNTNIVHTKYAKTKCCHQHCTTQFESINTDAWGYENEFRRDERNSDGERIKCIGSHNLKHERAFDTENVKIKTAHVRKNSSIENFDTIRKYCEDVEGYIRSRDPMFQREMVVVENLTKELQSTEFNDQRKDPQNLDGSEKKKSKNELLTVIPKILCSEEGHKKQNENQEVSIECQLCIHRNKAVNWCDTCEKNICRSCKLYHEKVWLVMDHEIQPLRIDELICETMNFC